MRFLNVVVPLACVALVACGDSDDPVVVTPPVVKPSYQFEVTVTNLTYAQPMSPVTIALHQSNNLWQIGESASTALELLAEGGDNSDILNLDYINANSADSAPLPPGQSTTLQIATDTLEQQKLSLISMMVNTNDGFTGLNAIDVAAMRVGDSMSYRTVSYDAGTEANMESMGTIPGPADGGEGFNAERNDVDFVSMHPGVVGNDDGLTQSVLSYQHKFDNPLLAVSITRTQ